MALATGLLLLGQAQREALLSKTGAFTVWDYTPPARQLAYVLNAPALLPVVVLQPVLPAQPLVWDLIFVAACGLFWYWAGRRIDIRLGRSSIGEERKKSRTPLLLGFVISSGAVVATGIGIFTLVGLSLVIRLCLLLWSIGFALYFGRELWGGSAPSIS